MRRFLAFGILICTVIACGEKREPGLQETPNSIEVVITDPHDLGLAEKPLPRQNLTLHLDLRVIDGLGKTMESFNGYVRLSARPGRVQASGDGVIGNDVLIRNGEAKGVVVTLSRAFGVTTIWAQDIGFLPSSNANRACSDKIDNDGDGRTDYPWDDGCFDEDDDSEEGGSGVAGVSAPIYFDMPTVAEIQGKGESDTKESPFSGEAVLVKDGFLVVTQVTKDGMYVTDIEDAGPFNHIFIYNFNTPPGVRVCDRVKGVSGIISEFYKFTELNFPSWTVEEWHPKKGQCPVPEPVVLDESTLASNKTMEGYESALVRVVNVRVADELKDCDFNKDGSVDYRDYSTNSCSEECACRERCEQSPTCTEINQYRAYGQWAVSVGNSKVFVVSQEALPDFDPFAEGHKKTIASITGNLRNMSFLKPAWIIYPRCPDDIVFDGSPKPIAETCVKPRTSGEEDEPN
jgi:hypothetical protein